MMMPAYWWPSTSKHYPIITWIHLGKSEAIKDWQKNNDQYLHDEELNKKPSFTQWIHLLYKKSEEYILCWFF